MSFKEIIGNRRVWIHFFLAFISMIGTSFLIHLCVASYTDHNESYAVPDLKGLKVNALQKISPHPEIKIIITDSVYDPKTEPGIVIRQEPFPGEKLKRSGKIYVVTTTTTPPRISMPRLTDLSVRQAKFVLVSNGLKCGSIIEKPADCNGCVVDQLFGGKSIKPGDPIQKGSVIHLVVGTKKRFISTDSTYQSATDSL